MGKNCLPLKEISAVLAWFEDSKRVLPWRNSPTPYQVWISEVMLQQTQAAVVIPYYVRWMQQFPDVRSLAQAPFDRVLKAWEGLGYYSRVRNLHTTAQIILERYQGTVPDVKEELAQLPGLGDYTINAILAFAFKKKALALDANVCRVLARFFGVDKPIDQAKVRQELADLGMAFLACERPWESAEALIELGALICNKTPLCHICPLNTGCTAFRNDSQDLLPMKRSRPKTEQLHRFTAIVTDGKHYLLRQNKEDKLMQDLWEFPYFPADCSIELKTELQNMLRTSVDLVHELPKVKHSFTRFRVTLAPSVWKVTTRCPVAKYTWVEEEQLRNLSFSSGHRKILKYFLA